MTKPMERRREGPEKAKEKSKKKTRQKLLMPRLFLYFEGIGGNRKRHGKSGEMTNEPDRIYNGFWKERIIYPRFSEKKGGQL